MSQEQLREAHDLIEQGRIAEARQLLQTLDDPTAKQWLAQLNAAKRARKQRLSIPLPLLVALALLIGVGALIVMLLLTPTLLARLQNPPTPTSAFTADQQIAITLTNYCTQSVSNAANCGSWVQMVMVEHHEAVVICAIPSSDTTALRSCLINNNVPLPT
ncbi:MAG: hypothetical protein GC204_18850 [Chloroflexi bacterium]|nr:hypothetical protein [Chloroflexota bacterium]